MNTESLSQSWHLVHAIPEHCMVKPREMFKGRGVYLSCYYTTLIVYTDAWLVVVHIREHCLYTCKRVIVVNLRCRYELLLVAGTQVYISRYVVHGRIESHDGN